MAGVQRGSFDDLESESPYPGVERESFDSAGATVTRYRFDPGAGFPLHRHDQEQLTMILDGGVTFTAGAEQLALSAGDWSIVPGGVEHGVRAGETGAVFLAVVVPGRDHALAYSVVEDGD
jgi:quercetin dioxygenase-like cupin family protein